jgi:hypothetical protein
METANKKSSEIRNKLKGITSESVLQQATRRLMIC